MTLLNANEMFDENRRQGKNQLQIFFSSLTADDRTRSAFVQKKKSIRFFFVSSRWLLIVSFKKALLQL